MWPHFPQDKPWTPISEIQIETSGAKLCRYCCRLPNHVRVEVKYTLILMLNPVSQQNFIIPLLVSSSDTTNEANFKQIKAYNCISSSNSLSKFGHTHIRIFNKSFQKSDPPQKLLRDKKFLSS